MGPGYPLTYYIAKNGFELVTFLPPPPEFWDHRWVPPHLVLYGAGDGIQNFTHARQAFCQ